MKLHPLILAILLLVSFVNQAQVITAVPCDMLGMSVNVGSQETMISIYHSGQYMTHPQSENVFMWEFTDQQGNILYQETLVDASTISFGHNWSLTDTINVTVHFVNDSANTYNWDVSQGLPPNENSINCLFEDQLYWETGSPTPWGSWTFIHNNPGVDYEENCEQDLDEDGICDTCEEFDTIVMDCACEFFDPATYTVFFVNVDEENCLIIEDCYCECINDIDNNGVCDENEIQECIDVNQIDPTVFCPEIYDPVCGCDGITYSNSCEANFIGGVTSWENGPCIEIEYGACTYPLACNYDPNAFFDDGSCIFQPNDCDWPETWANGCTYVDAINYDESAIVDNGTCVWESCSTCPGDIDNDGVITTGDLLEILSLFGSFCEETNEPNNTIEGKWIFGMNNLNTMYIFEDGFRYTYYCSEDNCYELYNSYEAGDGNHLTPNPYTFENNILTVDLFFGNELIAPLTFECDGDQIYVNGPSPYYLYRLNSNCE